MAAGNHGGIAFSQPEKNGNRKNEIKKGKGGVSHPNFQCWRAPAASRFEKHKETKKQKASNMVQKRKWKMKPE